MATRRRAARSATPSPSSHSTTRALYASYNGPLYQVLRQSDGRRLDIGVVQPVASPVPDGGGYANAAAQDAFCANTLCLITRIYDHAVRHGTASFELDPPDQAEMAKRMAALLDSAQLALPDTTKFKLYDYSVSYQPEAISLAPATLPQALLSPAGPRYLTSTTTFGLICFAPAVKPASNFLMRSIS